MWPKLKFTINGTCLTTPRAGNQAAKGSLLRVATPGFIDISLSSPSVGDHSPTGRTS